MTPRAKAYALTVERYRGSREYVKAFRYFNRQLIKLRAYSRIEFSEFKIIFINLK